MIHLGRSGSPCPRSLPVPDAPEARRLRLPKVPPCSKPYCRLVTQYQKEMCNWSVKSTGVVGIPESKDTRSAEDSGPYLIPLPPPGAWKLERHEHVLAIACVWARPLRVRVLYSYELRILL